MEDGVHDAAASFTLFIVAANLCFFLLSGFIAYICEFGFQTKHRVLSLMFSLMTVSWTFSIVKDVMTFYHYSNKSSTYACLAQVLGYMARSFSLYAILWYLFFWMNVMDLIADPVGKDEASRQQKKRNIISVVVNFGICALFTTLTIWFRNDPTTFMYVTTAYHMYWGCFVCGASGIGIIYGRRVIRKLWEIRQTGESFDVDLNPGSLLLVFVGIYGAATLAFELWLAVSQLTYSSTSINIRMFVFPLYDALLEVILLKFFGWQPLSKFLLHRFSNKNPPSSPEIGVLQRSEDSPRGLSVLQRSEDSPRALSL